jgi:hypothetical protein
MTLKNMTDDALLVETRRLVQKERELLSDILHHLREIERRRLFSILKCSSLFEYATRELGYSEDQAYRRIQAMRLLKDLPEIEAQLNSGALTLTHLGMAQSLFRKEEKIAEKIFSRTEKIRVLKSLANTSKRDAEKILVGVASSSEFVIPRETVRTLPANKIEIRFTADQEILQKIDALKGLLAHKFPQLTIADLVAQLCDLGLKAWSPASQRTQLDSGSKPELKLVAPENIQTAPARNFGKSYEIPLVRDTSMGTPSQSIAFSQNGQSVGIR